MDPISAAVIGLSVASLALQLFKGCLKGYEILCDAAGMPAEYQHLRVRLKIEQTRLLNWGQKIDLIENRLKEPSRTLQLNRSLIIDILLEVQALFRQCVKVAKTYDGIVPEKQMHGDHAVQTFNRRFPHGTNTIITQTLAMFEKAPQVPKRLQWVMVRQDRFKVTVQKLIGYNDSMEAILDSSAVEQLQIMHHATHLALLQLNNKVDELKELSLAMQIKTGPAQPLDGEQALSRSSTLISHADRENENIAMLADFKIKQKFTHEQSVPSNMDKPVDAKEVEIENPWAARPVGRYQGQPIWIEWKSYDLDHAYGSQWDGMIRDRVSRLAALLGTAQKPQQFRSPQCLGYFEAHTRTQVRYGFLFQPPANTAHDVPPTSLLELIKFDDKPSLTHRISLATAVSRSVLYLHSVNWLHKGIRSSNVVFFVAPGQQPGYAQPILSGFEYARPDLHEEQTEKETPYSEHDIYRHPEYLASPNARSQKSSDIYSLGIALVEIAIWRSISDIVEMPEERKQARQRLKQVRPYLLTEAWLQKIESEVGIVYTEVTRTCIAGGERIGLNANADETDPEVGARIQHAFAEDVVGKLTSIRI